MAYVQLVADGDDLALTVARRSATFVYGQLNVTIPEGAKQVESDDRVVTAFVHHPDGAPGGRFDVAFTRQDVSVDMELGISDFEHTLDSAARRVEGETLFQRDITTGGLGIFRPGVDFDVGDVVDVRIWGRRLPLPVAAIAHDGADTTVTVGGQLIRDGGSLVQQYVKLTREVERERRERRGADSAARRETRAGFDSAVVAAGGQTSKGESLSQLGAKLGRAVSDSSSASAKNYAAWDRMAASLGLAETDPVMIAMNVGRRVDETQDKQIVALGEQAALRREFEAEQRAWNAAKDDLLAELSATQAQLVRQQPFVLHASKSKSSIDPKGRVSLRVGSKVATIRRESSDWEGQIVVVAVNTSGNVDMYQYNAAKNSPNLYSVNSARESAAFNLGTPEWFATMRTITAHIYPH